MAESPDETEEDSSEMPGNSNGYDRRLSSLERWREQIDGERGQIMAELGEIKGIMQGLGPQMTALSNELSDIKEKLEDRPSRSEFKEAERQIESVRAKASKGVRFSELEVTGPANMKFKLLGVSGVTIVLVFVLIVVIFALWFLRK